MTAVQRRDRMAAEHATGHLAPTPARITLALDAPAGGRPRLEGPDVDLACGAVEPAVDRWETGDEVPTVAQLRALSALTGYPLEFFYLPPPQLDPQRVFICPPPSGTKSAPAEQLGLFDAPPAVEQPDDLYVGLSVDARRTVQQKATIARGRHPLTGGLAFPGASCGTCPHAFRQPGTAGSYLKCRLGPNTRGPGTDIRVWWPACIRHPTVQEGMEARP
jgi:hypothetical protein